MAATPFAKLALAAGDHAEHAGMSMAATDHSAMGHAAMIGSDALAPGGVLLLGKVETLFGPARERLVLEEPRERIYRLAES